MSSPAPIATDAPEILSDPAYMTLVRHFLHRRTPAVWHGVYWTAHLQGRTVLVTMSPRARRRLHDVNALRPHPILHKDRDAEVRNRLAILVGVPQSALLEGIKRHGKYLGPCYVIDATPEKRIEALHRIRTGQGPKS